MDSQTLTGISPALDALDPGEGLSRELTKYRCAPDEGASNRNRRWRRRHRVQQISRHVGQVRGEPARWSRVESCGRAITPLVAIKERGGRCYPSGVLACGSVWLCPVCSARIRTARSVELETGAAEWVRRGGRLAMVTFTLRHDRSMSLSLLLLALLDSYTKTRNRRGFRALRSLVGGSVRSLEVTMGGNGWHPHLHLLLFVTPGVTEADLRGRLPGVVTDWRAIAGEVLGSLPSVERAVDLTWFGEDSATAASYVSKIAKEVTMSDTKSGRDPFALLDVVGDERDRAVALWCEYAEAMKGRHAMDWTPGLRELLGLGPQLRDEELVDDAPGDLVVAYVGMKHWNRLWRSGEAHHFLASVERSLPDLVSVVDRE